MTENKMSLYKLFIENKFQFFSLEGLKCVALWCLKHFFSTISHIILTKLKNSLHILNLVVHHYYVVLPSLSPCQKYFHFTLKKLYVLNHFALMLQFSNTLWKPAVL